MANRGQKKGIVHHLYPAKRWMYRGDRPGRPARVRNRLFALQFSAGILSPTPASTLEVLGRVLHEKPTAGVLVGVEPPRCTPRRRRRSSARRPNQLFASRFGDAKGAKAWARA